MVQKANRLFGLDVSVMAVENRFFGTSVTVAGLVTGGDLIRAVKGKDLGDKILIPDTMLRKGQDVFLDDVTVPQLAEEAGIPVVSVPVRGEDFLKALLE